VDEIRAFQIPTEWTVEDVLVGETIMAPRISLHVSDVLDPPLSFAGGSFDVVVDKGLFDALMENDGGGLGGPSSSWERTRTLFSESSRVLCDGGSYVCVSLGESHVIRLIVDASATWGTTLRIYEVPPLESDSSGMRPFAFVLTKRADGAPSGVGQRVEFHREDGFMTMVGPDAREVGVILEESRAAFRARRGVPSNMPGGEPARSSLAQIHVKPLDDETDLSALAARIAGADGRCCGGKFSGLAWRENEIVPIGYGLSKLILSCVVEDDRLDELCECIGEEEEEWVQSVDVDWENTVPIMVASNVLKCVGKSPIGYK